MNDISIWPSELTLLVSPDRDHIRGPLTAPVTLVEYGDYECPHCAAAFPVTKSLHAALGNRLCFVYRHFPLATLHPHATAAAEVAEAAGAEGRFWEMHGLLFANQHRLEPPDLLRYAAALSLDPARVAADLSDGVYADKVRKDFASGVQSGVRGTPTFFINGRRHDGSWAYDDLLIAIGAAAPVRAR